jgi:ABC-2 type transport system ATP-binding protein
MLTGILKPTSGDAIIAGSSVLNAPLEVKQKIGVLLEDYALFHTLTIWEHLMMSGPIYGLSRQETKKRSEQLLRYLDLWDSRHTQVDRASYGMKKKCSLAMALLHNPKILFLDEPFEGIDPGTSRCIKDLLISLSGKGVTIFLTSHMLEVVERLVHQFAIIRHGEVVCCQSIEECVKEGKTLEDIYFQYIGRMNTEELEWLGL